MSFEGSMAARQAAAEGEAAKKAKEKELKAADRILVDAVTSGKDITHEEAARRVQAEKSVQDIDRQRHEFLAGQVSKAEEADEADKARGDYWSKAS
jgi:hypothetical protein